jgi:hypothetical protein
MASIAIRDYINYTKPLRRLLGIIVLEMRYSKIVIPAKAGIQKKLDAGSSPA